MQPHDVRDPRRGPGNDNDPKRRMTFWLLVVVAALAAAISVNLVQRLL